MNFINDKVGSNYGTWTSKEIACIICYLEGKRGGLAEGLKLLKRFSTISSVGSEARPDYYTVDSEEVWQYFKQKYENVLLNRKIDSLDMLVYRAIDYVEKHSEL